MPIPTLITDLSTTASSNSPAGSDSPATLDDIQRAHASFIAQLRDGAATTATTLASATGASLVGYQPTGGTATTVQSKLRESVSVKDFGAVGDDSDETTKLVSAFAKAAGGVLTFEPGKVYLTTEPLLVQAGTVIDLNGSTLNFACVGAKRNLAIVGSNVIVRNGTVNNTVGSVGYEGTYQTPIVIGQSTSLTGFYNVLLQNLSISTVLPGGNGIAVFGDSHNIAIDNIEFPDSAFIGIPILAHWSFTGGYTPPYTGSTTHPHNLSISNIRCGALTYGAGSVAIGISVIFLSAVYNVTVSNVYAEEVSGGKIVTVYAGDWGFQFGTVLEQALGSTGISVTDIYGKAVVGFESYMLNPLEAVKKIWPSNITIKNMAVVGYGSTNTASRGFTIDETDVCVIDNCVTSQAYYGVVVAAGSNVKIKDSVIREARRDGFLKNGSGVCKGVEISGCSFVGNNASNTAAIADVRLASMSNVFLYKNTFNSINAAWSVIAANTVTGLRCVDNITTNLNTAFGPCYSLGAQADTNVCIEFQGNTCDVTPTNGFRGGQLMIPVAISMRHGQSSLQKIAYYTAVPDRGTWSVGDKVIQSAPVVGQPKGWVCTVAGTPGTWVSEGNL